MLYLSILVEPFVSQIQRSAIVPYSAEQMFQLINDVLAYPKYMPGCVGSEVLQRGENLLVARLDLARAGIRQSFVTKNTLNPPHSMLIELQEGPFSHFHGKWEFVALNANACKISFELDFKFANKLVGLAAGKLFESVASKQVEKVCERARIIYGEPIPQ